MLTNADPGTLTVHQIAAHLDARVGNVTRELNLAAAGQPGRLCGVKVSGPGIRGRSGQWRVRRDDYLQWLGIPDEDRDHLDGFGLPQLMPLENVAAFLAVPPSRVGALMSRLPHVTFGRRRYLTHHQLQRLRVLLNESDKPRTTSATTPP